MQPHQKTIIGSNIAQQPHIILFFKIEGALFGFVQHPWQTQHDGISTHLLDMPDGTLPIAARNAVIWKIDSPHDKYRTVEQEQTTVISNAMSLFFTIVAPHHKGCDNNRYNKDLYSLCGWRITNGILSKQSYEHLYSLIFGQSYLVEETGCTLHAVLGSLPEFT